MGIKENWWRFNYHLVRLMGVPAARQILRLKVTSEGEIPNIRPIFLAPVHRTSIDMYAIANVADEFISYISTDTFGHSRLVNFAQKVSTKALGSIIWQESGIENARQRAVVLAHDVEDRLARRLIVAAFTQGEFQFHSVESVEEGLIGLLRRYETRHRKEKGHDLKIPIVPVGIEYQHNGTGLALSKGIQWCIDHVPFYPRWVVPAVGSRLVVRFGEPQYFEGRSPLEMTNIVMRESARLSNIPFNARDRRDAAVEETTLTTSNLSPQ